MQTFKLIIKGFIVGLGKIVPGVSGSLLALSLGIYEDAIKSITNFFEDKSKNILFLGKIGLGVVIAILVCSKLLLFLLNKYYLYTLLLFIGLICGTVPYILKKVTIKKKSNLIYILVSIILVLLIDLLKTDSIYIPDNTLLDYMYIVFIGFLDAATMIIPGISGTATFMMLGCYNFVLEIFSNPFYNIFYSCCFALGLILGILLVSKLIEYLLEKKQEQLYLLIIGFSLSSIFYLYKSIVPLLTFTNFIPGLILILIGYLISNRLN